MPSNESLNEVFQEQTVIAMGKRKSQMRKTVTTTANIKADSATVMVSDINGKRMVKRGTDGRIPSNPPNDKQFKVQLEQLHYKEAKTEFDIYTQQGAQFDLMKDNVVAVAERRHDEEILKTLGTNTRKANPGAAVQLTSTAMLKKILGSFGGLQSQTMICMAITSGAYADMHDIKEFGNHDYIQDEQWKGVPKSLAFTFFGINFIIMPDDDFEGALNAKKFYAWKPEAVAHICDMDSAAFKFGYNDEDDYSWARTALATGSRIIQPSGVIEVEIDVSANTVT